jgi:hypothetical protein
MQRNWAAPPENGINSIHTRPSVFSSPIGEIFNVNFPVALCLISYYMHSPLRPLQFVNVCVCVCVWCVFFSVESSRILNIRKIQPCSHANVRKTLNTFRAGVAQNYTKNRTDFKVAAFKVTRTFARVKFTRARFRHVVRTRLNRSKVK